MHSEAISFSVFHLKQGASKALGSTAYISSKCFFSLRAIVRLHSRLEIFATASCPIMSNYNSSLFRRLMTNSIQTSLHRLLTEDGPTSKPICHHVFRHLTLFFTETSNCPAAPVSTGSSSLFIRPPYFFFSTPIVLLNAIEEQYSHRWLKQVLIKCIKMFSQYFVWYSKQPYQA